MSAVKEEEVQVAQLVAEIDNLNSLINGIEKEMLKLKQRYEVAVEERNYTGIQVLLTTHYSLLTTHYLLLTVEERNYTGIQVEPYPYPYP